MLSESSVENDQIVFQIDNFYNIRESLFSHKSRKPTPVVGSCFS